MIQISRAHVPYKRVGVVSKKSYSVDCIVSDLT